MKSIKSKNICFPESVLILGTYDENGRADAMNAAWGGRSDTDEIAVCLSSHQTTDNLFLKGEFTVAFADEENVAASDYVGLVSLKDEPRKMEKAGLVSEKAPDVDAPLFENYPITLQCKVRKFIGTKEEGGILVGEILSCLVKEEVLDENGAIDLDKAHLICLDEAKRVYRKIGEPVAKAFSVGLPLK